MLRFSETYGWPPVEDHHFRFSNHETLPQNINRLLMGQIQHAVNCLNIAIDPERAVHVCRVAAKRIDAVLVLLGERPKVSSLRKQNRILQKMLSKFRDTTVLRNHIAKLPSFKSQQAALARIDDSRADIYVGFASETQPIVLEQLELMQSMVGLIKISNRFSYLMPGFSESYTKARLGVSNGNGQKTPSAKKLHRWRKHVKRHGYHLELMMPCAPVYIEPRLLAVNHIGHSMGEYHDLELTHREVSKKSVRKKIRGQQAQLLADSLALQRWVMQPKPELLSHELKQRWDLWHKTDR